MKKYKIKNKLFGEYTEIVVNLINVNEHKIRLNVGGVRLLVGRFEQSKLFKYSSKLQN